MNECDISGVKIYPDLSYIFSGVKAFPISLRIDAPWCRRRQCITVTVDDTAVYSAQTSLVSVDDEKLVDIFIFFTYFTLNRLTDRLTQRHFVMRLHEMIGFVETREEIEI